MHPKKYKGKLQSYNLQEVAVCWFNAAALVGKVIVPVSSHACSNVVTDAKTVCLAGCLSSWLESYIESLPAREWCVVCGPSLYRKSGKNSIAPLECVCLPKINYPLAACTNFVTWLMYIIIWHHAGWESQTMLCSNIFTAGFDFHGLSAEASSQC